jgi:hypothetical protein
MGTATPMPLVATSTGAQDETAPEDHRGNEDDAGQGNDHGRKPERPTAVAQSRGCGWLDLMLSHAS